MEKENRKGTPAPATRDPKTSSKSFPLREAYCPAGTTRDLVERSYGPGSPAGDALNIVVSLDDCGRPIAVPACRPSPPPPSPAPQLENDGDNNP